MNASVVKFPRVKVPARRLKPRTRVFWAGYRYIGGECCQEIQQVYLKRHGNGDWSFIIYVDNLSWELERFSAEMVPIKLDEYQLDHAPSEERLEEMGWRDSLGPNVYDMQNYKDYFAALEEE